MSSMANLQGGWESDESEIEAVRREAMEEAGVHGNVEVSSFDPSCYPGSEFDPILAIV